MMKNKNGKRDFILEQTQTVSKLFAKSGIDLALVGAGRTLYQSLRQAKKRTKKRKDYIAKGIKYTFNSKDSLALLEVINGNNELWQAWILQHEIFERIGLDSERPTLHRLVSNGHYELSNIAVLPSGEHQQEHAVLVYLIGISGGKLGLMRSDSITKLENESGISKAQINSMDKCLYQDESGEVYFTIRAIGLSAINSEEEHKAQCEAHGITYQTVEERAKLDKRLLKNLS